MTPFRVMQDQSSVPLQTPKQVEFKHAEKPPKKKRVSKPRLENVVSVLTEPQVSVLKAPKSVKKKNNPKTD